MRWVEIADVTGLTLEDMTHRANVEGWPEDAKVWWDDDHVFLYVERD
jgi:hypothetical protein